MTDSNPAALIARESRRFAAALADCDPAAPVPTCPGWTAKDLGWHLATVHRFWGAILRQDPTADEIAALEATAPAEPTTLDEVLQQGSGWTAELVSQLDSLSDATPRWSWFPADQTVGFTRRMQLAEATMHRVDAELTADLPVTPLEPELAKAVTTHAVEVMYDLEAFLAWLPDDTRVTDHGLVAFEASDTGDRWLADVVSYAAGSGDEARTGWALRHRAHGAPDATVTGPLAGLACWLWTRPGLVTTAGRSETLDAVLALHEAGIQ